MIMSKQTLIGFKQTLIASGVAIALLSGCSSTPESMSEIDQLRQRYEQLAGSSDAEKHAPVVLNEAERSVDALDRLVDENASDNKIDHQVYLTGRKLDVVEATIALNKANATVANAEVERKDILLNARTREAEQAKAEAARLNAEAQAAKDYAELMAARAKELEETVDNLTAKETERGLVLSLDNILFEFDKATVKPGAERTLEKVSEFLNEYPDREIIVEGFTDSTGNDDYNLQLSERRAEAVKNALTQYQVTENRVQTKGYGEAYPVASNDTDPGRLQNRRVEIVIADQGKSVSQRTR
jgi:outer membrane protein OmpA-like peptidoglycan-associated protein